MTDVILNFFLQIGFAENAAQALSYGTITIVILLVTILATWLTRNILLKTVVLFIQNNQYKWDDALVHNDFFWRVSWFKLELR